MKRLSRQPAAARLTCVSIAAGLALAPATASAADGDYVDQHYPDFGFLPPPQEYKGRVFTLSQKYPKTLPRKKEMPGFLNIDFRKDWKNYLLSARNYCFQDNVQNGDVANDFDAALRENPTWFHVPWQHYGPNGREGVHGLTKEAPVQVQQFALSQTSTNKQMYAVGLYNRFGGYTIGQVWADKEHPDSKKAKFPVGTVVMKILFTDCPTSEVPSLVNPLLWNAYITDGYKSNSRVFQDVALLQMDLMVRDKNAPHGWVFGTYQYNGKLNHENKWKNLVPVGIQWGNDPDVLDPENPWGEYSNPVPAVTRINPDLKETIINPDPEELPPTHLGWNGRLNGPADIYRSSCMSCHMTAQAPAKSPMSPLFQAPANIPNIGSKEWMRWFQNVNCGEKFDANLPTTSVDFSLQLAASLQNFYDWRNEGSKINAQRYTKNQKSKKTAPDSYRILRASE